MRHLWIVMVAGAVVLIFLSQIGFGGADLTETAARKFEKTVGKRMAMLDGYMQQVMEGSRDEWPELKDFPEDMVIYRYVDDSLQSWCNQFTLDNDDIGRRTYLSRFYDLRYNIVSPLIGVGSEPSYMNFGPSWYLVKAIDDGRGCRVIGGLELRNTQRDLSLNSVNPRLGLSDRFAIYPISYSGGSPVCIDGRPLIKVLQENPRVMPMIPHPVALWVAILLILGGMLMFLYYNRDIRYMLLTLIGSTLFLMAFYIFGMAMKGTVGLFSPTVYADGRLFYSLGALLIFNTWIVIAVSCIYICRIPLLRWLSRSNRRRNLAVSGIVLLAAAIAIMLHIHLSFKSIIANSNITLELYQIISISWHSVYVYLSYLALFLSLVLVVHLMSPVLRCFYGLRFNVFSHTGRLIAAVVAAIYLVATSSVLGFRREESRVGIWAGRLAVDRDLSFELQLRNVERAIANDPVIPQLIAVDRDYRIILNRISENYMRRMTDNYNIDLYMFKEGETDPAVLKYFHDRIQGGVAIADSSRFMYSRGTSGRARYTGLFTYYNPSAGVAHLLLGIESKADRGKRGYAAILDNSGPASLAVPQRYSYAKYLDDKLVSYHGDYAYPTVTSGVLRQIIGNEQSTYKYDNFVHFVRRISDDEVILISREVYGASNYIVAGFMLALLAYLVFCIPRLRHRRPSAFANNYYKQRINTVLFVSLVSTLVTMVIISVFFVYRRNQSNIFTLITNKIGTIRSLVEASSVRFSGPDDFSTREFSSILADIGGFTSSDISLYTTDGKVFKSTCSEVFERMAIGSRMDPEAFKNIMYRHKRYYIHKEKVASRDFYSMYAPVFNSDGKMLAIICAPYTDSGLDFRNEALFHSIFIITAFFILLLLTRIVATRVVDKMFSPLIEMGRKMGSAGEGGLEYIFYDRDDEIASLVKAYNRMVHDVSESSKQAAQIERDRAWSEMARQVAHEIKNPLTPIKLQIQRVIRLRDRQAPDWEEKFDQIAPVILDSIDTLTDTANEFSTFAKLYNEPHVLIDIDRLISDEISLFDERDNISFQYFGLQGAEVMGPKPQLIRVIVNLLTNAVQAIENAHNEAMEAARGGQVLSGDGISASSGAMGRIFVALRNSTRNGFYDIVVEDNGPGVRDENRSRLFTPNFTTKSGGTGLGLAICRNILERCGGEISYSKSFTLGGACFTVRLPKAE